MFSSQEKLRFVEASEKAQRDGLTVKDFAKRMHISNSNMTAWRREFTTGRLQRQAEKEPANAAQHREKALSALRQFEGPGENDPDQDITPTNKTLDTTTKVNEPSHIDPQGRLTIAYRDVSITFRVRPTGDSIGLLLNFIEEQFPQAG